jgi:hypothetical protein
MAMIVIMAVIMSAAVRVTVVMCVGGGPMFV